MTFPLFKHGDPEAHIRKVFAPYLSIAQMEWLVTVAQDQASNQVRQYWRYNVHGAPTSPKIALIVAILNSEHECQEDPGKTYELILFSYLTSSISGLHPQQEARTSCFRKIFLGVHHLGNKTEGTK